MPLPPPVPQLPPELVVGARLVAEREALLPLLPKGGTICEVGVAVGFFSRRFLDVCAPRHFIAIDNFRIDELGSLWGQPVSHWFGDKTHHGYYVDHFADEIAAGRMTVLRGESHEALARLEDGSLDVLYIDADHGYQSVRRDLAAGAPKVAPGGFIVMNDYILVDHLGAVEPYGVIYATHEFMIEQGWRMRYLALQTSMFCDVVLERVGATAAAGPVALDGAVLAARERDVARLRGDNEALRREVAALRRSTSWRVTAPLRAVGALLRSGR